MQDDNTKVMGWGTIILILVAVAVVTGMVAGLLGSLLGLRLGITGGGIGASVGVVGAILITRRRTAMEQQNNR
jgi:ABC-type lipoprotein release transport system permease subunit